MYCMFCESEEMIELKHGILRSKLEALEGGVDYDRNWIYPGGSILMRHRCRSPGVYPVAVVVEISSAIPSMG